MAAWVRYVPFPGRWLRVVGIVLLLLTALPGPAFAAPDRPTLRVLEENAAALDVVITFPAGSETLTRLVALPWWGDASLQVITRKVRPMPSPAAWAERVSAPSQAAQVRLEPVGILRGVRLARLVAHPAYRDARGRVWWVPQVRVRLTFPPPPPDVPVGTLPSPWARVLRDRLLNPTALTRWVRPRALAAPPGADFPPARDGNALRLYTREAGIYVVTREAVAQAGWDVDAIDPRNVHLWVDGREVPVWFTGQGDGRWDPGDELRFYAPPFQNRYTQEQVWWLTVEPTRGARWRAVPSETPADDPITVARTTETTEFDALYDSRFEDAKGEPWFWFDLKFLDFPPYPALDFAFRVPQPANPAVATVTLTLYAYKGAQHDLAFRLNGVPAGELHASWLGPRTVTFSLPDPVVQDGWNTLTVRSTDQGLVPDGVYVDRITVTYRRRLEAPDGRLTFPGEAGDHTYQVTVPMSGYVAVLDVSDPYDPVLIYRTTTVAVAGKRGIRFRHISQTPALYHVEAQAVWREPRIERNHPSQWRSPREGADVIVLAPRAWHATLVPWVRWRESQGHRVALVALQDVYDEFNYGRPSPEAIRRFIQYAYAHWPDPAPQYVLLVGDGSYDFKNYTRFDPPNLLPPYLARVDPWLGETAADLKYVEVDGNDEVPDLFLGRWPVDSAEALTTVVRKTLYYERDMPTAEWQRRILFVADNYRDANGRPDAAGDFVAEAERTLQGQLRPPWRGERLYYMPWLDGSMDVPYTGFTNVEAMRSALIDAWNEGRGIINWIGHASYEQWGAENFLHARRLETLQNAQRLPFLFSISCFTGFYHHPEYASLDEALLEKPDGGVVASWSPTGLAVAYGHRYLQEGFYEALVGGERQIGPLTLAGTLRVLESAQVYWFLPQTYILLGDPLLELRVGPVTHTLWLPTVP